MVMSMGVAYALIGGGLAVAISGIGSAIGVATAGHAVSGLVTEEPDRFGKALLLQAMPATQGLYGFIIGFLVLIFTGAISGNLIEITDAHGLALMGFLLPVGITECVSAVYQGRLAVSAVNLIGKRPEMQGRAITMLVMVEMFAIFAFLAGILSIIFLAK